jgi:hypothetical protein
MQMCVLYRGVMVWSLENERWGYCLQERIAFVTFVVQAETGEASYGCASLQRRRPAP